MKTLEDLKVTRLIHHYEEGQFKYSKVWLDNLPVEGIEFYAKVPVEFLGKKVSYTVVEENDSKDGSQSLKCKIRGKGYLVVNAKTPRVKKY